MIGSSLWNLPIGISNKINIKIENNEKYIFEYKHNM